MATRPDDLIYGVDEAFAFGLADFLTNVYPDRLECESKSARSTVRV